MNLPDAQEYWCYHIHESVVQKFFRDCRPSILPASRQQYSAATLLIVHSFNNSKNSFLLTFTDLPKNSGNALTLEQLLH